jgi:hypothetical protein
VAAFKWAQRQCRAAQNQSDENQRCRRSKIRGQVHVGDTRAWIVPHRPLKPSAFSAENGGSSSAQSLACGISNTRLRDFAPCCAAPDGCLIHASARLPLEAWLFS